MDITKLLNKANFEIQDIKGECPPCSIIQQGKPIGFIQDDFIVTMIPEKKQEENLINSIIHFGQENFGYDEIFENEYQLSGYDNYILTSSFDLEEQKPMYNVYQNTDEGFIKIDCNKDKKQAAQVFAEKSNLIDTLQPHPQQPLHHPSVEIPSFFEILKEAAQKIGMKLKLYFSKDESFLKLKNGNKTVATIDDKLNIYCDEKIVQGLEKKVAEVSKVASALKKEKAVHKVVPKKIAESNRLNQNTWSDKKEISLKEDYRAPQEKKQRKTVKIKR